MTGGSDFPFSNNGPNTIVTHAEGDSSIIINSSGVYEVNYSVDGVIAGVGTFLAVAVNGVIDPSTEIGPLVSIGEVTGIQIMVLNAGDVVTLRNDSTISYIMNLAPGIGARMVFLRLANIS